MELKEAQIYSITNLDLIYIFATDSILNNETNKYIGAKVVYDNKKTLTLDYTSKHFEKFVRKILEVYNKEKDERDIILLGDLTKELINNSSFDILSKEKESRQEKGIAFFNTEEKDKPFQLTYLKEALKMILLLHKNYEMLDINSIDGYNHKYIVDFTIASVNKKMPILISKRDKNLDFKINRIENTNLSIEGTVENNNGRVIVTWTKKNQDLNGYILYDARSNLVQRTITSNNETIFYNDNIKPLTEEDIDIIDFYFNLGDIKLLNNIIKTSDNTYLLAEENNNSNSSEEVLYETKMAELKLKEDEVNIKYTVNNGFSKYQNQINVNLDEDRIDITIKKIKIEKENYILIEKSIKEKKDNGYTYRVLKVDKNTNLTKPFEIIEDFNIEEEITNLDKAKEYIKNRGGQK